MKKAIFSFIIPVAALSLALTAFVPVTAAQTTTVTCPAGYTCTAVPTQPINCPAGFICTPNTSGGSSSGGGGGGGGGVIIPPTPVTPTTNACYVWSTNLTIGSTGADVVALQTWLMGNGFDIPALSQGRSQRGYYGATTAAAVARYQASVGIPATGFLGALTRAALNASCTPTNPPVSGNGIVASLDSASPLSSTVQISTSAQTNNVPLAAFDIKSQGGASTLQSLQFGINVTLPYVLNQGLASALFSSVSIRANGQTYYGTFGGVGKDGIASFNNFSIPLPANVNVPITLYGGVNPSTSGSLDGSTASASLLLNSIVAIDQNYNTVPVSPSQGFVNGNTITFSSTGVQVSNTSATLGAQTCNSVSNPTECDYPVSFNFSLTSGNNPIYIAKTGSCPVGYSCLANPLQFSGDNTQIIIQTASVIPATGDGSNYYYIAPGQTRQFTYSGVITNSNNYSSASTYKVQVSGISYGTSANNLSSNSITSGLQNLQATVSFNGGSTPVCPVGYTCVYTPGTPAQGNCPAGYVCTPTTPVPPASGATVTVNGQPTLALTYDSTQKESALTATFNVTVRAGNSDLWLYTSIANASLLDQSGRQAPASINVGVAAGEKSDAYGRNYTIVSAGHTVQMTVTLSANPKQLFAGSYHGFLSNLYTFGSDINNLASLPVPSNHTNEKVIIGEVSPYISSVTPSIVSSGQTLTVQGQRFTSPNAVVNLLVDGSILNVGFTAPTGGNSIIFTVPSLSVGYHNLQVSNSLTGASNQVSFQVQSAQTTSQPPVISGGTFPTTLSVGQQGTWTVNAYDPNNGSLSYSVNWGDTSSCPTGYTCAVPAVAASVFTQSSTFTHSYSTAGTYTATFTVQNAAGLSAQTTSTVQVGNQSPTNGPLSISSISPAFGYADTGNHASIGSITIYGGGFSQGDTVSLFITTPSGYNVSQKTATVTSVSPNQMTVSLPTFNSGNYSVQVSYNGQKSNVVPYSISLQNPPPASVSVIQSVASNSQSGDTYYNPRFYTAGWSVELDPANDAASATAWCKAVSGKSYTSGSFTSAPYSDEDVNKYDFNGSQWIRMPQGEYASYYTCSGSNQSSSNPGFTISFDKSQYSPTDIVHATISRVDGSSVPYAVDTYVSKTDGSMKTALSSNISVGQAYKIDINLNNQPFTSGGADSYMLVVCGPAGQPCNYSSTSYGVNSAPFTITSSVVTPTNPVVSNTSATLGAPMTSQSGTTTYPVTFTFTLTSGNNPIYVSSTASLVQSTASANLGVNYSAVTANPGSLAGDGSGYYIISPGTSRTFTLNGTIVGFSGAVGTVQVSQIYYGTSSDNLQSSSISQGLGNLMVSPVFSMSQQSSLTGAIWNAVNQYLNSQH